MSRYLKGLLLLLGLSSAVAQAEDGVMLKDEILRASASATAGAVGDAAKGSAVDIISREGGWTQIKAGGKVGWVRLLSVRKGSVSKRDAGAELGGVLAIGVNRSDSSRVVATAGLRGLSEEELKAAKFDQNELTKLESFAVSKSEAQKHAKRGNLVAQTVDYLPEPSGSRATKSDGDSGGGHNIMGGD